MTISERLFAIMKEKNVSMPELSRRTGISRFTIYDWQRRETNPGSDKIMIICEALSITPEELLIGKPGKKDSVIYEDLPDVTDDRILEDAKKLSYSQKKRLLAYMSMLQNEKQ